MITSKDQPTDKTVVRCDLCLTEIPGCPSIARASELEQVHLIWNHDGHEVWPNHPASRQKRIKLGLAHPEDLTGRALSWTQQILGRIDKVLGGKR